MTNKVQYQRQESGNVICFVDEGNGWVHHSKSKLNAATNGFMGLDNSGYRIFQLAVQAGYEVLALESGY